MTLIRQRWTGLGLLVLILVALGMFLVPAHFGSLWGDRDFTDWNVPLANRLHGDAKLYTEGLHLPMPPLPTVLPRIIFPHGAVWWDGSLLNYCFQAGMILLLFWAISSETGLSIALIAALAVIPVYLSMQKTMLYDSMAQFLVAAIGVASAGFVRRSNARPWGGLAVLGSLLALLFLTKQNTALGALAGVCLLLLFLPRAVPFPKRFVHIVITLFITVAVFCLVALALNRFLSFSGLIHDVFLTGSEPKGGPFRLIKSLIIYSLQIGVVAGGLYLLIYIFDACIGNGLNPLRTLLSTGGNASTTSDVRTTKPRGLRPLNLVAGALIGSALGLALSLIYAKTGVSLKGTMMDTAWGMLVLNVGLCLVLLVMGSVVFQAVTVRSTTENVPALAPYAVVFFFSALFHNLSVARWRWTVDNNPLVFAAVALVVMACLRRPATNRTANANAMMAVVAGFIVFIMWPLAHFLTLNVVQCTQTWPEIRHLAGAKLRPDSDGMRRLTQTVRSYADPDKKETVLLLPNDPNIESWFERDRPKLSCAIIFTDQYWDRYVDLDFAALQAQPPKVIVIGPRNYWRYFCRGWHVNGATEKLIDRVNDQMIAKNYELKSAQEIVFQGGADYMDVYVRRADQ